MITFIIVYKTSAQIIMTQTATGALPYVPRIGELIDIRGDLFKVNNISSQPEANTVIVEVFSNAKR